MRLKGTTTSAFAPGLHIPYPSLAAAGVRIRRGQTSLTVAAPGSGKSQLWANLAQRMQVPSIYWSADTDQADVTARTLAMWLGIEVAEVEHKLSDTEWRQHYFSQLGTRADHIEWVFDSRITGDRAGERLEAFAEVRGEYPHLMVFDNLSNAIDAGDEYAEVKAVMSAAQTLARDTNCHIAVLHHSTGNYEDGTKPIPQGGAVQKAFKTVELGLTLFRPDFNRLGFVVVKNRGGISDPGASNPHYLPIDFTRASVLGYEKDS